MNCTHKKWLYMIRSRIIIAVAALFALTSCGCEKKRDLPDVDPAPYARYSTNLSFTSTLLGRNVPFDILLPEDYNDNPDKRYPVMYMFHGLGDDNTSWNGQWLKCETKIKELESNGLEPMIYVFPMGWKAYGCDRFDGRFPYMTMIATEFVPMIDATYRTIADKEHRGTIGYSMGGFAAMVNAMKHPELFSMSAPLSMSMCTDKRYMSEPQGGWDSQWGKIFGGQGKSGEDRLTDYYKAHCPLHQFTADNISKYNSVRWFLTCGDDEDQLLIANDDLHVLMRDNGYPHEFRVWNGGHSSSYWRGALEEVLPYFSALMAGQTTWQKSLIDINVPDNVSFTSEGLYISEAYSKAEKKEGVVLYISYDGINTTWIKEGMAIIQRGMDAKQFVLIPCDLSQKGIQEWVQLYKDTYPAAYTQALAIGKTGNDVLNNQNLFSSLYFENATLEIPVTVDPEKYYYIGQCDEDPAYKSANALYKECKAAGGKFEYRCRNHIDDEHMDFLTGMEYVKTQLNDF